MGRNRESKIWWGSIRRKLFRPINNSSHRKGSNSSIIVLHTNDGRFSEDLTLTCSSAAYNDHEMLSTSREDIAALTIQACFRGHLARRAFRALRSLVKLQALVRGVVVRRQARIALCCMNALARLQITVRARQLLDTQYC